MENQKNEVFDGVNSQALASQVVVYRALGFNKDLAIQCMAELSRRAQAGEQFEYETFIETELAKIPKPKSSGSQLTSMINQGISALKNMFK